MNKKLTIIIVHWNTPEVLKKSLALLLKKDHSQIIVIDNSSTKKIDWVKKEFPAVELIENKINRGYAFACNQGVVKAKGEWLLFLNPDVEISPEQIEKFLDQTTKNNFDASSIKTDKAYQKPLPSWLSLLSEFTLIKHLIKVDRFKIKTLFGGCLLIKKQVLESLGGWDERFFLWFEDSDLTQRLLTNDFKIGWITLPIKHEGGKSFRNLAEQFKKDIFFNSMEVYARKHFNFFAQIIIEFIKRKYSRRKILPETFAGVSITVPNLKKEMLEAFLNQGLLPVYPTFQVEWIVVTSSVEPQHIWEWRRAYPEIRFIPIDKNKGFASTVNIGFRVSTGKWLATINDDIINNNNWITDSLYCFKKDTGSVNPVILKPNSRVESVGISIEKKGKALPVPLLYDRTEVVHTKCIEVDATNAAAVIYSKEALNKVGIFDEKFGSYLEDIDLSLRLKRAGYKNIVSLSSEVTHLGQTSLKALGIKKQLFDFRNWFYVILKNWSLGDLILNFPAIFIERLRNLSGIIKALI